MAQLSKLARLSEEGLDQLTLFVDQPGLTERFVHFAQALLPRWLSAYPVIVKRVKDSEIVVPEALACADIAEERTL